MMKLLSCSATLLFATSTWAAEAEVAPAQAPTETPAPTSDVPPSPPPPPAVVVPAPCPPVIVDAGPEPETGWSRGLRAPMYASLMLFAGGFAEDGDNRLTTRDSKFLEGFGGVFRVGAVLDRHHRLGGRMQSFVRPTKKIALAPDSTATTPTDEWGAVTFGYVGPEYIYTSDYGVYAGASVGIGFAMSARDIDHEHANKEDDMEKGSGGIAAMLSAGYEWRVSKWFALNAEVFGGLYHGVDDNENGMDGAIIGMGMGVGF